MLTFHLSLCLTTEILGDISLLPRVKTPGVKFTMVDCGEVDRSVVGVECVQCDLHPQSTDLRQMSHLHTDFS